MMMNLCSSGWLLTEGIGISYNSAVAFKFIELYKAVYGFPFSSGAFSITYVKSLQHSDCVHVNPENLKNCGY